MIKKKKTIHHKSKDDVTFYISPDDVKKMKTQISPTSAMKLAEPLDRLWAQLIDYSPMILGVVFITTFKSYESYIGLFFRFAGGAFSAFNWVLLLRRGQTVGKFFRNIRIANSETGKLPSWTEVLLLRTLLFDVLYVFFVMLAIGGQPYYALIPLALMMVDVLFIFSRNRRCIHDLIANTTVVEYSDSDSLFEALDKSYSSRLESLQ